MNVWGKERREQLINSGQADSYTKRNWKRWCWESDGVLQVSATTNRLPVAPETLGAALTAVTQRNVQLSCCRVLRWLDGGRSGSGQINLHTCEQCALWLHALQVIRVLSVKATRFKTHRASLTGAMPGDRKFSPAKMTEVCRRAETSAGQWWALSGWRTGGEAPPRADGQGRIDVWWLWRWGLVREGGCAAARLRAQAHYGGILHGAANHSCSLWKICSHTLAHASSCIQILVSIEGAFHANLTIFDKYEIETMWICYLSRALAARAFNREVPPTSLHLLALSVPICI